MHTDNINIRVPKVLTKEMDSYIKEQEGEFEPIKNRSQLARRAIVKFLKSKKRLTT